jgi:hypoxanthine phosphoribosyltransferase
VVIVDDLVQSGGTLIECHALLSSLGAKHGEQHLVLDTAAAITAACVLYKATHYGIRGAVGGWCVAA